MANIKDFFVKLMGWEEQRTGAKDFHQQESIEHDLAEERKRKATEEMQERVRQQMKERQTPSEAEITGPSDSKEN